MTNCPECDAVMKIPDDADESQIVKTGWSAFIMGALVWGGLMNLIYLMF